MIVIDIETTGLDPKQNAIASIGAVHLETGDEFYIECRVQDKLISDAALEINGFTRASLCRPDKPTDLEAVAAFFRWCEQFLDRTPAGENIQFDLGFLREVSNHHCRGGDPKWPFGRRMVDLHSVSYTWHLSQGLELPVKDGVSNLSLDATLVSLGFDPEPRPHNALVGARLETLCFKRLLGWA